MATIRIDQQEYTVRDGDNLLQTCLSLGLDLPYFCWHPAMGSIGACRQCAVLQYQNEEDQRGRLVMGCMTPVSDGAIFSLQGDKAQRFRKTIVESLMLNHPHDCPVCAEGGECHLQDMTVMTGHRDRSYRGRKNTHRNQYLGPLIHHEMNRCITCYRCTRYYRDYAGGTDLAAMAAHDHIYFGRHEDGVLESEFAGNLVEVCPTGVFTDRQLVHQYTRKWDLQSAPSVCTACAVGCNIVVGERYGKVKRVHNRFNAEVNGYFLCDRGRFGAGFVNLESRLEFPALRRPDGRYDALDHHRALEHALRAMEAEKVAAVGSPRASVEANHLLRLLVGNARFYPGWSRGEQGAAIRAMELLRDTEATVPDLAQIETADAVLILGEDVTNTSPRVALSLRQAVRNRARDMAGELRLLPWQDAAIRNLAQDTRNPLHIAAVSNTRLDDVAASHTCLAPPDIARLGAAVLEELLPGEGQHFGDPTVDALAQQIARDLRQAKRPLIIAGAGYGNTTIMEMAAELAAALCHGGCEAMLSLCQGEANSMGLALLTGTGGARVHRLEDMIVQGDIDTLLVLENDVERRCSRRGFKLLRKHVKTLITLDSLDTATTSLSDLVLPTASFAESEGTLVNHAGRAQRYFPAFPPANERRPAWFWLLALAHERGIEATSRLHQFDEITRHCAASIPALAGITEAAPRSQFRAHGLRVPRQTHRYSGRTAMRAALSVHEPKQPQDEETPLAFSMEGSQRDTPGALLPYFWSPGWNSNQSLHRYQKAVGEPLRGGTAGSRLLYRQGHATLERAAMPGAFEPRENQWYLVPRHAIFGSDELSALSPPLRELTHPAWLEITPAAAQALQVIDGDGLIIENERLRGYRLEVRINPSLVAGCAAYSAGHAGTFGLLPGEWVTLQKDPDWQRREPAVIASDRGGVA